MGPLIYSSFINLRSMIEKTHALVLYKNLDFVTSLSILLMFFSIFQENFSQNQFQKPSTRKPSKLRAPETYGERSRSGSRTRNQKLVH